jgi:CDP-4-dehydro-6-deoxyglucose reductase
MIAQEPAVTQDKFSKPWHGIPRSEIPWFPTVDPDVCIGCGTCVISCSRSVYRLDFDRKKAVVADPMHCMVGCRTCASTCPANAISFPPGQVVLDLELRPEVRHAIEDELLARREQIALVDVLPHPDRMIQLDIREIREVGAATRLFLLAPHCAEDCLCEFTPGQYVEIWVPGTDWMSRAYSIANAPSADGSVELQLKRVEGGRLSSWAFEQAKVGDVVTARGPLGAFTTRSAPDRPLVFVARGTGFAPMKALIEQQLRMFPQREMRLFWGATSSDDFYDLDAIASWLHTDPQFHVTLAAREYAQGFAAPEGTAILTGRVSDAVAASGLDLAGYDGYVAGPRVTVADSITALEARGMASDHIFADSYGV